MHLLHPEPRHEFERELQDDAQAAEAGARGEQFVSTANRSDDGVSAGVIAGEPHGSDEAGEAGVAGAVSRRGGGAGDGLPRDGAKSRQAERRLARAARIFSIVAPAPTRATWPAGPSSTVTSEKCARLTRTSVASTIPLQECPAPCTRI